jgi:hypothetical protein
MLRWAHSWLTINFLDAVDGWTRETRAQFAAIERSFAFRAPAGGRGARRRPRRDA